MAEAALFGLAQKLLGELSSTAFKKAYERVRSIRNARKELEELEETIQTIHLVLLDAEKKQEDSALVKNWIQRVRDVLYEADDLSDDVFAADALLEGKKKGTIFKFFKRNISNDDIANKVKDIRKSLDRISQDLNQFNFIQSRCENQVTGLRKIAETRPFVDEKVVFGREDEKKAIIEFLLNESDAGEESTPAQVIAVVGIGGMGKTTLAQLVYNDEQVSKMFQKKWWACISDVPGKAHLLGRISASMDNTPHTDGPEVIICKAVRNSGKYLLVLDDVWDNDLAIWFDIMSLLCKGTKGSKIIVTTRSSSVPKAMQKDKSKIYDLCGLSAEKSWELFKAIAYTEEQENSPEWVSVGREIVKKCANVPLAIKSIAGVLRTKDTLDEWNSVKDDELLRMESFFPCLRTLKLTDLPKLKGWSRQWSEEQSFFPHLAFLYISGCPDLEFMPRSSYLEELDLLGVGEEIVHQLVSTSTASLHKITIESCDSLKSFPGEGLTSLRQLQLYDSSNLETVQLASNSLHELIISECPKVGLWGHTHKEEKRGLHWSSLTNLRRLGLDEIPEPDQLPQCLRNLAALGKLKIEKN